MKFKAVGRKKALVGVGFGVMLAGLGVAGWNFMPEFGFMRSALALVGLSKSSAQAANSTAIPTVKTNTVPERVFRWTAFHQKAN